MSNIRPLPYRDVIKKLRKCGFAFRRSTGGSHEIWWNEKTRMTCVIPHHKEIKVGTLRSVLRQANVSEKEFLKQ